MGKWTPDYLENVLQSKISNLVTGAINRAAVEKEPQPTITFESFVSDLDAGDSFTTSLIDILVKELADRRTRSTVNDRRLIADHTAKSLRLLATPLRIYRERNGRSHTRRTSANYFEYLSAPPNEMDVEEDEDEFDNMLLDNVTSIEGTRVNSELYEAIGAHSGWPSVSSLPTRRIISSPSPPLDDDADASSSGGSNPVAPRSGPWSMPPAATSSSSSSMLVRQPSIRRPPRSRTVDFNEYTHRRRSSIRDALDASERPADIRDGGHWVRSTGGRRFFPLSRTRRNATETYVPWTSESTDTLGSDTDEPLDHMFIQRPTSMSGTWIPTIPTTPLPDLYTGVAEGSPARPVRTRIIQRVRRSTSVLPPQSSESSMPPLVPFSPPAGPSLPIEDNEAEQSLAFGDLVSYPTPGSTENENVS
ncbi:hypothetical protein BDQ12DRAFT_675596 [Crucibulum laeve]|uniref:Uncharacterized protein n=1 Tax=Crucibulum laeve TaxID=68775 RepID=A0A5C3MEH7_9AGAR|nr:hypothetical protein BDQ12DRAFT_675596 [Crucibulum laeve]